MRHENRSSGALGYLADVVGRRHQSQGNTEGKMGNPSRCIHGIRAALSSNDVQQRANSGAKNGLNRATVATQKVPKINDLAVSSLLATDQKVRSSNLFGRAISTGTRFKLTNVLGPQRMVRTNRSHALKRATHALCPAASGSAAVGRPIRSANGLIEADAATVSLLDRSNHDTP
jgi:hypothetical protein